MERINLVDDKQLSDIVSGCLDDQLTLKEIHQIPEIMMENLYAHAYQFYQQGKLDNAETFFKFLCMYDFYNTDYFMGLAAVYQLKKHYQKAADLYAVVFAMKNDDYRSVFYAGQCQVMLGEKVKARRYFELIEEQSEDELLVAKAVAYLKTLKNPNDSQLTNESIIDDIKALSEN